MKTKRIISTLLAVAMLLSAFAITISAEEATGTASEYTYNTSNAAPTMDYLKGTTYVAPDEHGNQAPGSPIDTPEKKLATMDLKLEKDGYQLYVDSYSGEIAFRQISTGELMFSNPYDVGSAKGGTANVSDAVKKQLLSQIVVNFTNITSGASDTFYSFEETIQGESKDVPYPVSQVTVKNIKNGIRVEYSIGREEARLLLPRQIEKTVFETKVLSVIEKSLADQGGAASHTYRKFLSFYLLQAPGEAKSEDARKEILRKYPITKKMDVYVLDGNAKSNVMNQLEGTMKTYCQSYTYEDLDEHHLQTEYESEDQNPPLFRMALEYTLDSEGLNVRLPANGIRFNESLYQLTNIEILPYMGAGKNPNAGYTFFPDGSGTIFDFEQIAASGSSSTITGKVYGQDFAYHEISGENREIIRYPVFGLTETETFVTELKAEDGTVAETLESKKDRGFIAIVEEGDAMMELSAQHEMRKHPYNTVKMTVYPRPKDSYNVSDAISVGSNESWTVVSSRKYTGSYRIKYMMLTDDNVAKNNAIADYYTCDYVGMAKAYRSYLEDNGTLTRLTADDIKSDIPLYINTFGSTSTTKKILSIPVNTMAPLTTFEDIQTMYNELSAEGVKNINFILTGYTDGGLDKGQYPSALKWEKSVGGKKGFEELVEFAKANDIGIFPDFDFAFISGNTLFDGVTLKKHAVKTIDDRYTSKRVYSGTKQTYMSYFELAISPAYFNKFYEKLTDNYSKYEPTGISVGSLGTYLNSDFDEDEPYNREDSKEFTINAFEHFDQNYAKVMTSGGNAYSWKYVDYITDVALDSSRYAQSAASVPFLGMVLHGYVQFAGTPINMEGNIDYAMLKAIESGASINFMLSYQNTSLLKESEDLSKYYSIRYDIWFDDVVSIYNELNAALKDVQTSLIVGHEFIDGHRVPDNDELLADAKAELEEILEIENALAAAESDEHRALLLAARKGIETERANIETVYKNATVYHSLVTKELSVSQKLKDYNAAQKSGDPLRISETTRALSDELTKVYNNARHGLNAMNSIIASYEKSVEYMTYLRENSEFEDKFLDEIEATISAVKSKYNDALKWKAAILDVTEKSYDLVKDIAILKAQPFEFVPEDTSKNDDVVEEEVQSFDKYAADQNQIAIVTYDNGTSFVLNFNNYTVTADVENDTYTIPAYGYVILKK